MLPRPFRLRRGRRTDFVALMQVLAASGLPVPPPDRATLRRFRRLVADLGADLYVAVVDEHVVGLVHATYARQLTTGPRGRLETIVVAPAARRQRVGAALVSLIVERARRRGCVELRCAAGAMAPEVEAFFDHTGWRKDMAAFSIEIVEPGR